MKKFYIYPFLFSLIIINFVKTDSPNIKKDSDSNYILQEKPIISNSFISIKVSKDEKTIKENLKDKNNLNENKIKSNLF